MTRSSIILLSAVLCLSIPGLAQDGKPENEFRKALAEQNEKKLEEACRSLVGLNTGAAAKLILSSVANPKLETDVYWILIRACAAFSNSDPLKEVAEYVLGRKGQPVSRDLAMALHNNFTPAIEGTLCIILRDGNEELRLLALDHLADIGQKEAVQAIVDVLKKEGDRPASTEVRRRMFMVLGGITGQDLGESHSNWVGWWEANRDKPWDQLKKGEGGSSGGSEFGYTRSMDLEKVKAFKVLLLHGSCKKSNCPHDLDPKVAGAVGDMGITVDKVTKQEFEKGKGGKLDSGEPCVLQDYLALIVMCTMIREHCVCPKCKPSGDKNLRLFTCGDCNEHENYTDKLGKKGADMIRKYVENGGYLFTEDWAIIEVLEQAFPEFVKAGKYLKEQDVPVLPKPGSGSHPYLRKIFVKAPTKEAKEGGGTTTGTNEDVARINHEWHIDQDSPAIKIIDKARVTTLLFSETVGVQSDKDGSDACAITFAFGKGLATDMAKDPIATGGAPVQNREKMTGGRVMHVLSHFGKQGSRGDAGAAGEATLMNLMVNYLSEAAARKKAEKKP